MNEGDPVKCENCGKVYRYFRWAMGSDRCYCRRCVANRPQAHLDDDRLDPREAWEIDRDEENDNYRDEQRMRES